MVRIQIKQSKISMDNDFCDFINDHSHHSIHSLMPIGDDERENTNLHDVGMGRKGSQSAAQIQGRARCSPNKHQAHQAAAEVENLREQKEMSDKYKKKLLRNRESAKNSRKRKKTYLDLLERKVAQLNLLFDDFKSLSDNASDLLDSVKQKLAMKQDRENQKVLLLTNLQNSILSHAPETNVERILEQIYTRFGNAEKGPKINHYFNEIINQSLPKHEISLLTDPRHIAASTNKHQHQDPEKFQFTPKQKEIINKQQSKFQLAYQDLLGSLSDLHETNYQINHEISNIDNTFTQLRSELKPSQQARFLIDCEQKDLYGAFKPAFEESFGTLKAEDVNTEVAFDMYSFMKENKLFDSLDIEVAEAHSLYNKGQDFIKKRYLNNMKQYQDFQE